MVNFSFLNSTFTSNSTISFVLRSFFGLGKRNVSHIIVRYALKPGYRVSSIPLTIISDIEKYIFSNFRFGRSYHRVYLQSKSFKIRAGLYSGVRLSRGLPSRGQRSKTNASTSKRLNSKLAYLLHNLKKNMVYFNSCNRKGVRRRGFKFSSNNNARTFFFKKKRSRIIIKPKKILNLQLKKKKLSRRRRILRRFANPFTSIPIRYASDSRFFSKKKFFRKKGYVNSRSIRTGKGSIFRPRLNPVRFSFPSSFLYPHIRSLGFFSRRKFFRLRSFWFKNFPRTNFFATQKFLIKKYFLSLGRLSAKGYFDNFKFYSNPSKRSESSYKFLKRFSLFRHFQEKNSSLKNSFRSPDPILFHFLSALKFSYRRFLRSSYSFFFLKNEISQKNKLFFEKFRFKLSTYLALYHSFTLTYFKHFFLNNTFFIRFIPTNSNFFINFGFYDRVIFQISAGQPIVGFPNSGRSTIPAITNLVRYFTIRLKRFVKTLFPMVHSIRFSRRRIRRRLKIPVYYVMEKGVDRRVKVAFKQMITKSFWRAIGVRLYVPLPHSHTLRAPKRRRR